MEKENRYQYGMLLEGRLDYEIDNRLYTEITVLDRVCVVEPNFYVKPKLCLIVESPF